MARNMEKNNSSRGKKTSSNRGSTTKTNALGTNPSKASVKKRLIRTISAASENSGQRGKTPTFHQPGPSTSRQAGRHHQRRLMPASGDEEEEGSNEGSGSDEEDVEDDEDALERLQRLPVGRWYKALGKMFTLRIWPWTSQNWWIGDLDQEVVEAPKCTSGSLDPMQAKLATAKEQLETKAMNRFKEFVVIDMAIETNEWMSREFRSKVPILRVALSEPTLTIAHQFQSGARAFRSEIVGNLKKDALLIFQIDDIPAGSFLDPDARAGSEQLVGLRQGNNFLYATKEAAPGLGSINRYLRSECISRVSEFPRLQS